MKHIWEFKFYVCLIFDSINNLFISLRFVDEKRKGCDVSKIRIKFHSFIPEVDWRCLGMKFLARIRFLFPLYIQRSLSVHLEATPNIFQLPNNHTKTIFQYFSIHCIEGIWYVSAHLPFRFHRPFHFYRKITFFRGLSLRIDIHTL